MLDHVHWNFREICKTNELAGRGYSPTGPIIWIMGAKPEETQQFFQADRPSFPDDGRVWRPTITASDGTAIDLPTVLRLKSREIDLFGARAQIWTEETPDGQKVYNVRLDKSGKGGGLVGAVALGIARQATNAKVEDTLSGAAKFAVSKSVGATAGGIITVVTTLLTRARPPAGDIVWIEKRSDGKIVRYSVLE
jgi:hypothetical protein